MTDTASPTPKGTSRWWRLAFALSLALNLAVAGIVAGAMLREDRHGLRPDAVRDLGFGPFAEALSDEDRAALRRSFMGRAPDLRAARAEMRADLAAILAALRADPYDPAALQGVLDRQKGRTVERLALGQALIFDHVASMTAEARAAFADRLEASLTRRHGHRPAP